MIGLLIPGWLKRAVAWAVAAAGAVLGAWALGRREGRSRAKSDAVARDAKAAKKTAERIADESVRYDDDADAARQRLRDRDPGQP